jgi:hypothetical protein
MTDQEPTPSPTPQVPVEPAEGEVQEPFDGPYDGPP